MTVDLRTRYLGLDLRSPIVASSSPLTGEAESARLLEEAGAAAIVLPSLFEEEILNEEIQLTRSLEAGTEQFAEALDYFPAMGAFHGAGDRYLAFLERVRSQAGVPVIASLNATTPGGWVRYARLMQDAGADALELNLYHVAADPRRSAADIEAADLDAHRRRARLGLDPARRQAQPVLLGARRLRRPRGRPRRGRARPLQPLLPAGPGPRDARRRRRRWT